MVYVNHTVRAYVEALQQQKNFFGRWLHLNRGRICWKKSTVEVISSIIIQPTKRKLHQGQAHPTSPPLATLHLIILHIIALSFSLECPYAKVLILSSMTTLFRHLQTINLLGKYIVMAASSQVSLLRFLLNTNQHLAQWFYDRWAGDIALTTLSGRQVATDILLATYGWRQLMNDKQLVYNRIDDVLSQTT